MKEDLPNIDRGEDYLTEWWQTKGKIWESKFEDILIEHRQFGYHWQFNSSQEKILKQYYEANLLLVNSLHSNSNCSTVVRRDMEETLLMTIDNYIRYIPYYPQYDNFYRSMGNCCNRLQRFEVKSEDVKPRERNPR